MSKLLNPTSMDVNFEPNIPELAINKLNNGPSIVKYDVTLVSGKWPPNPDLIDICDRGMDPRTGQPLIRNAHYGGQVHKYMEQGKDKAFVEVYID